MVLIDLKDAYISVLVAAECRKFLSFVWEGETDEFRCLPFCLSSAPRIITKLMKPVICLLRENGIRSIIFLDELLLMAQSKNDLGILVQEVLSVLQLLGFVTGDLVSWVLSELNQDDNQPTKGEGGNHYLGVPATVAQGDGHGL